MDLWNFFFCATYVGEVISSQFDLPQNIYENVRGFQERVTFFFSRPFFFFQDRPWAFFFGFLCGHPKERFGRSEVSIRSGSIVVLVIVNDGVVLMSCCFWCLCALAFSPPSA